MRFYVSLILLFVTSGNLLAQEKKGEKITFEDHVKPIFRDHCFSCHNQNKKEGDLDLTNFTSLMQGGGSGAVIEPGAVGDSYLFALVNHDEEPPREQINLESVGHNKRLAFDLRVRIGNVFQVTLGLQNFWLNNTKKDDQAGQVKVSRFHFENSGFVSSPLAT